MRLKQKSILENYAPKIDFNSTVVRLKLGVELKVPTFETEFQFYCSAIKTISANVFHYLMWDFNSTVVRLKLFEEEYLSVNNKISILL